jgi:hypothetical protein
MAANTLDELPAALKITRTRPPVSATTNPSRLIDYLADILAENEAILVERGV